jgi:hypothetical protein
MIKTCSKGQILIIDAALVASGVNEGADSETITLIPSLPGKFSCDGHTLLHGRRTKLGPRDDENESTVESAAWRLRGR